MSTSEYPPDAAGDPPISAAELAALAGQLYAAGIRPGFDSPPQTAPVAPRGNVPDTTAAASTGRAAAGASDAVPAAVPSVGVADIYIPAPTAPTAPGVLAGVAPHVPVAPRGSMPVLRPDWPGAAPSVGDLGWSDTVPVRRDTPLGDERNYSFLTPLPTPLLTGAHPAPKPADDHRAIDVFDVEAVRADFPILRETVNGKPLIWFDNAATTQKPQVVIDRLAHFYAHENSNIHRAAHELAARATDAYEEARDTVRRFIGAACDEEIIFVRGTTEAINLVAYAWGGKHLRPGDEIVITHLEHHANIVPWQLISQQTGAVLKVAPVDEAGNLLLAEFEALLGPKTKLVAATHVSNALGTVTPVHQIVELGHRYGARVLIDGAQSIPHLPIDVAELGADFFAFSGHKIYGPTGIGVLYGCEDALAETPPWQGGGNMITDVTMERSLYQGPPSKFEAGTGNIADAVGLGEALRYVERVGIERIAAYEHGLLRYATPRLADVPGVRLVGTATEKASVLSFVLAGHEPLEVGKALNAEGIAVRAGHHCAQPILRRYGLEATVRPSFAFYNTFDEIDVFISAVRRIAEGGTNAG
ncbi:family 2A encapsulin nanocompartment cargo protein cysteine desulfurase [Mycobacterium gastri]|uniref:cysteine desulfurase n=1 Tax=Mycobacterium gastri TaxID=1777 RepID=A0A1X1W1H8_MYCGS|nr:family 2A encapsulin nanocompartment cargo protein cysteine desulfurase [Mycobacterium gastri]ETW25702.1 cysteine desulfurase [Mycobacterium gastri 'Wayne']ORV80107.1 cysteine desulfurase [Mycobacterium gastri]